MASTINAQNTSSGVAITPDSSGILQLQTAGTTAVTVDASQNVTLNNVIPSGSTAPTNGMFLPTTNAVGFSTSSTERMRLDASGYLSGTVNSLGKGLYQAQQYYRLDSGLAGANATGAQSIFGVGVTLVGSTVYEFEIMFAISKSAGTSSHTVSIGFGGTATLNNIGYEIITQNGTTATATAAAISGSTINGFISTATATAIDTAQVSAILFINGTIKGTVSINAGGTFIPQYTLSAAPGGAYTTAAGSYIKISPLGASGANTSIGSWA